MDTLLTKHEAHHASLGTFDLSHVKQDYTWSKHAREKLQRIGQCRFQRFVPIVERQTYRRRNYIDQRVLLRVANDVYMCVSLTDKRVVTVYRDDFQWRQKCVA